MVEHEAAEVMGVEATEEEETEGVDLEGLVDKSAAMDWAVVTAQAALGEEAAEEKVLAPRAMAVGAGMAREMPEAAVEVSKEVEEGAMEAVEVALLEENLLSIALRSTLGRDPAATGLLNGHHMAQSRRTLGCR